jgi:hypothetical protein
MGNVPPQWGDKKICNAIWPRNVFRTVFQFYGIKTQFFRFISMGRKLPEIENITIRIALKNSIYHVDGTTGN